LLLTVGTVILGLDRLECLCLELSHDLEFSIKLITIDKIKTLAELFRPT